MGEEKLHGCHVMLFLDPLPSNATVRFQKTALAVYHADNCWSAGEKTAWWCWKEIQRLKDGCAWVTDALGKFTDLLSRKALWLLPNKYSAYTQGSDQQPCHQPEYSISPSCFLLIWYKFHSLNIVGKIELFCVRSDYYVRTDCCICCVLSVAV